MSSAEKFFVQKGMFLEGTEINIAGVEIDPQCPRELIDILLDRRGRAVMAFSGGSDLPLTQRVEIQPPFSADNPEGRLEWEKIGSNVTGVYQGTRVFLSPVLLAKDERIQQD